MAILPVPAGSEGCPSGNIATVLLDQYSGNIATEADSPALASGNIATGADHKRLVASVRARLQRSAAISQAIADCKRRREEARAAAKVAAQEEKLRKRKAPPPSVVFERSPEWIALSREARRLQPWCTRCGSTSKLQADHIKPKSKHPALALDPANIQVLCWPCNKAKGTKE